MNRLINADKILQKTWRVEIKDMFHMTETVEVVSAIDIKEAPTVEAIPIEWLQQMIEEDKASGHIDEYGEYQEGTTLGESCEHVLANWYNTYKWKWEKENDGRNC